MTKFLTLLAVLSADIAVAQAPSYVPRQVSVLIPETYRGREIQLKA
jgi:hypothetical protein